MARLLRPGGLLYCTTPNFNSLSRRVLRDRWTAIDYPEHLNYFTVSTLSRLFEQAGLRAISVTSSGLSVSRLRGGLCGAGARDPSGSETLDEDLRSRIERSTLLAVAKRTANGILGATRSGDTIKGWFELGPDNQRAV
jgi:hypothetical protein